MSAETIAAHVSELRRTGVKDLGAPTSDPVDAGYAGLMQDHEHGRVYWHAATGARALWGVMLQSYLDWGGPGLDPRTGRRLFGFPRTVIQPTTDATAAIVRFEFGSLVKVDGRPSLVVAGAADTRWHADGGPSSRRGLPVQGTTEVAGGLATWFEGGVLWQRDGAIDCLAGDLDLPLIGQPAFVAPGPPGPFSWLRWSGGLGDLTPALATQLLGGKLSLVPVGGGTATAPVIPLRPGPLGDTVGGSRAQTLVGPARPRGHRGDVGDLLGGAEADRRPDDDAPAPAGTSPASGPPTLVRRQLYGIAFQPSGEGQCMISPHAVYARDDWSSFGIAHITDLHASRRIEHYRTRLRSAGIDDADIAALNNWNDRIRDFIRYANHLHAAGRLDVVMATGDLIDYLLEDTDRPDAAGNFEWLLRLLTGEAPSLDRAGPPSEALRVPILLSLGNHDYRERPYSLSFRIGVDSGGLLGGIPIIGGALEALLDGVDGILDKAPGIARYWNPIGFLDAGVNALVQAAQDTQHHHTGLNTTHIEAGRLMGLPPERDGFVPLVRPEVAALAIRPARSMCDRSHFYFRRLNRDDSYVVALGKHRVVMLDTRWDAGIVDDIGEVLATKLGLSSEEAEHFLGGSPDSVGPTADELRMVERTLAEVAADADALVIVGMHAPPLNPKHSVLSNALRETVHPTVAPERTLETLVHIDGAFIDQPPFILPDDRTPESTKRTMMTQRFPMWPLTGTPYFHRGPVEDRLDYGTSVGQREALLRTLAGAGGQRPAILVLCGHGHNRFDFRIRWNAVAGTLETYHDHYLENPATYYAERRRERWEARTTERRLLVRLADGAPNDGALHEIRDLRGNIWQDRSEVQVPPNRGALEHATSADAWWRAHAPVIAQTAALGPCTNTRPTVKVNKHVPNPNFQGFRLLEIVNDRIQRVRYVMMDEVRTGRYPLAWETSVPPTPAPLAPGGLLDADREPAVPLPASGQPWGGAERDHRSSAPGTVRDHRDT